MTSLNALSIWLVVTLLCLVTPHSHGQQVGTNCTQLRVRKSWDAFSDDEKTLYLEAVGVGMIKGFHQKFVQIHTDTLSGLEAHKSCVFIYWHRMLLLGYENMLRTLDPKYQCITLPYWDHLTGTAKQASEECTSIESCSPIIADFGGTTTGLSKSLSVYGTSIPYTTKTTCVNQGVAANFCGNNTGCANCIIRTRSKYLSAVNYPNEASFGSAYQQVFTYSNSGNFTSAVENGIHNTVHNAMGGTMIYLQAPVEPIFYSHHALVDLLQTIYLKCQNGAEGVLLSAEEKNNDPRFWTSCARSSTTGGYFSSSDNITIRATAYDGKTYVNVWQEPKNILYPFFKDLPHTYAEYVDAKDLGNYSYTYEVTGGLANMYQNCSDSTTLETANTAVETTSFLADVKQGTVIHPVDKRPSEPPCARVTGTTPTDDVVRRWNIALFEAAKIVGFEDKAAREQMEMITCQHHAECIGPVNDYTDLYRTNFNIQGHPRCYIIVKDLAKGKRVIGIPKWRDITSRFLPCPAKEGAYKVA